MKKLWVRVPVVAEILYQILQREQIEQRFLTRAYLDVNDITTAVYEFEVPEDEATTLPSVPAVSPKGTKD